MLHMLAYLRKSVTWIITSAIGLVVGVGALLLNKSALADTALHWHHHHHDPPPAVPEVNSGLVLLPIVLAILLFTSQHLLRRRGLENR
jgi:nitric oxide reductase large subunit